MVFLNCIKFLSYTELLLYPSHTKTFLHFTKLCFTVQCPCSILMLYVRFWMHLKLRKSKKVDTQYSQENYYYYYIWRSKQVKTKPKFFFSVLFPKKGLIKKAAWKERETLRPKKRVDFFYSPRPFFVDMALDGMVFYYEMEKTKTKS